MSCVTVIVCVTNMSCHQAYHISEAAATAARAARGAAESCELQTGAGAQVSPGAAPGATHLPVPGRAGGSSEGAGGSGRSVALDWVILFQLWYQVSLGIVSMVMFHFPALTCCTEEM